MKRNKNQFKYFPPVLVFIVDISNWYERFGCLFFCMQDEPVVTTATGAPIGVKDATQTVGPRGPVLLQDVNFLDELSHFDRERIPERVVHAKGAGAFGYFEVTHPEIKKYSAAKVFSDVGKKTPIAVRFSTVGGESGSADTVW